MGGWREESPDLRTQTRWERGKASAAVHHQSHPGFGFLYTVVPAVLAVVVVPAPLGFRLLVAFLAASLGWIVTPYLWAAVVAVGATKPQRDEARASFFQAQGEISEMTKAHSEALQEAERRHATELLSVEKKLMKVRLELLRQEPRGVERAIQECRAAEAIESERFRSRTMSSICMQDHLVSWARDGQRILHEGSRLDLATQFDLEGRTLTSANQAEVVYRHLLDVIDEVLKSD